MPSRFFPNRLPDAAGAVGLGREEILRSLRAIWSRVAAGQPVQDPTAYTGLAGAAYTAWHIGRNAFQGTLGEGGLAASGLHLARAAVAEAERGHPSRHDCSLLAGRAGAYCVAALCASAAAGHAEASGAETEAAGLRREERRYAGGYAQLAPVAVAGVEAGPHEFLYGTAGYIFGGLLLNSQLGWEAVSSRQLDLLGERLQCAGRAPAATTPGCGSPLWYEWHGTPYLGAAHGLAGILHVLLHLPSLAAGQSGDIRGALRFVLSLESDAHGAPGPHGHYPSSMGPREGREPLVHWCHGAPGICLMLCKAYQVLGDASLLEAALRAGQAIWQRGLLKKGPGACHGISGNAFALLRLYRTTGDPAWLHRAQQFARFLNSEEFRAGARTPDHPLSLFEGEAGASCLFADLLRPERAAFPLFELDL